MENKTAIWDAVCTTNPDMTTKVTQRGGFTAIDAYYTVQRLTEQFGPVGHGWGWDADFTIEEGIVVCRAEFWSVIDGKRGELTPIMTMNKLVVGNGIDEDAGKKALTDALTKWASYLGFSADVFLGKFDDNRYVESLKAKPVKPPTAKSRNDEWQKVADALRTAESQDDLKLVWSGNMPKLLEFKAQDQQYFDNLERIKNERKQELVERAGFPDEFNNIK